MLAAASHTGAGAIAHSIADMTVALTRRSQAHAGKRSRRKAGLTLRKWRAFSVLYGLPLELKRADDVERGTAPDGVVEDFDGAADGCGRLGAVLQEHQIRARLANRLLYQS